MTRSCGLIVVVALLLPITAWAAGGASRASRTAVVAAPPGVADFERNAALGAGLETQPGTNEQYAQLQALADRGLKAARDLVAADPQNAGAQYLLGSWLIYGYRVVTTQEATTDAAGETRTTNVRQVVQGLSDDPAEGLEALRKAAELAPGNAQYTLDYAAALLDSGRPELAVGALVGVWDGRPALNPEQKVRAGIMLSDAYAAQQRPGDAREWLYAALLVKPGNAEIVERLRALDAEMEAPAVIYAPPTVAPSPEAEESSEAAPSEPAPAPEEAAPESSEPPTEEVAPEQDEGQEMAPEEPAEGSGEQAEPEPDEGQETAPEEPAEGSGEQAEPEPELGADSEDAAPSDNGGTGEQSGGAADET